MQASILKAIIVDDEHKSRESLKVLVNDFCKDVLVIGAASNVKDAIELIEQNEPDFVFLDIQMNAETGFDLLKKAAPINFEVIFTTAHSEYAIEAIKFSALDYLLKPIDVEELKQAVQKYRNKKSGNSISRRIENLIENFKNSHSDSFKMALPTADGLIFMNLTDITYFEADGSYTKVFKKNGEVFMVTKNLKEYEGLLMKKNFFRIHNSYLINLDEIERYVKGEGGYVVMKNGKNLDVSKRKKQAFLSRIN